MDSTLIKGLAVLEWLARRESSARVADVAAAFDLPRSNAHRTLQTLVASGWAVQNPHDSSYRPSLRLFELGALVDASTELKVALRPHLTDLANATRETIHLTVLDGAEVLYLDKIDSPMPVAAYSRVGGRAPAWCVASGKALLSVLEAGCVPALDVLQARLGRLIAHTDDTITSLAVLRRELERSRARGFAENREEWRVGVSGLGAAVFNARSEPVAAIGISVPSIRFGRARTAELAAHLVACASAASRTLGQRAARDNRNRVA